MSKKQRTREARGDDVEQALVDDLRVRAKDLRAPRSHRFAGRGVKTTDAGGVTAEMPFRLEPLGTVIFTQLTPGLEITIMPEGNVPSTT